MPGTGLDNPNASPPVTLKDWVAGTVTTASQMKDSGLEKLSTNYQGHIAL